MSEVPGVQLLQPLSTHRSPIEAQSGIALIVVMISIFVLTKIEIITTIRAMPL